MGRPLTSAGVRSTVAHGAAGTTKDCKGSEFPIESSDWDGGKHTAQTPAAIDLQPKARIRDANAGQRRSGEGVESSWRGRSSHGGMGDGSAESETGTHGKHASPSLARYQLSVRAARSPSTREHRGFPVLEEEQGPSERAKRTHGAQDAAQHKPSGVASFSDISTLHGELSTTNSHDTSEGATCVPGMHGRQKSSPQKHVNAYGDTKTQGRGRGTGTGDVKLSRSASSGRGRSRGYLMEQVRAAAQRQQSPDVDPTVATGTIIVCVCGHMCCACCLYQESSVLVVFHACRQGYHGHRAGVCCGWGWQPPSPSFSTS